MGNQREEMFESLTENMSSLGLPVSISLTLFRIPSVKAARRMIALEDFWQAGPTMSDESISNHLNVLFAMLQRV